MSRIEYLQIVNEMSDSAFQQSADLLFEEFGYKVMKRAEFRKVDLKESLLAFQGEHSHYDKKKKVDYSDSVYADNIISFLTYYVYCKEGSRAAKYYQKAKSIGELISSGKAETEDLVDLTRIYIAMMREVFPAIKDRKKIQLSSIEFSVKKDDEELLREMKGFDFRIPKKDIEKGFVNFMPTPIKKGADDMLTKYISKDSQKFTYIISSLLYCRAMQEEGEYSKEEE